MTTSTAQTLKEVILARRDVLVRLAEEIVQRWYRDAPNFHRYAPSVRKKPSPGTGLAVSIFWTRRRLVSAGLGRMMKQGRCGPAKLTKVVSEYIAPRRTGAPYPSAAFPRSSPEELVEIENAERELAPIRRELKTLGRLLLSVHAYRREVTSFTDHESGQSDGQATAMAGDWDDFDPYDE